MRLRNYSESLDEKMSEFDIWVTPSLGEIKDMQQFQVNLDNMKSGFQILSVITNNFADLKSCSSSQLATNIVEYISGRSRTEQGEILNKICTVLLLVTGKTDNNLKCQYPLLLRNVYNIYTYPQKNSSGQWTEISLPRELKFKSVTKIILHLSERKDVQERFLESYIHLILSEQQYVKQLWCLGSAFLSQSEIGNEDSLLSPIVMFQSRGSITATQGHIPENILRSYMDDWGMIAGSDYNMQDVEIGEILEGLEVNPELKKRKFDFILPYQSRENGPKIFIQSQFYAGDSGSVSHKVVDQTDSSREVTLKKYPYAVFVEYLDGAGYFSSLNGDLRKMLAKPTTKDFIQINSAPLKLRRELQEICFLTVLEVEHAILITGGRKDEVISCLGNDGYSNEEINCVIENAKNKKMILEDEEKFMLTNERETIVRKYCLLDIIANYGEPIPSDKKNGLLIVPGYATIWGMSQANVIKKALEVAPMLNTLWKTATDAFEDIQWLLEKGFIKSR